MPPPVPSATGVFRLRPKKTLSEYLRHACKGMPAELPSLPNESSILEDRSSISIDEMPSMDSLLHSLPALPKAPKVIGAFGVLQKARQLADMVDGIANLPSLLPQPASALGVFRLKKKLLPEHIRQALKGMPADLPSFLNESSILEDLSDISIDDLPSVELLRSVALPKVPKVVGVFGLKTKQVARQLTDVADSFASLPLVPQAMPVVEAKEAEKEVEQQQQSSLEHQAGGVGTQVLTLTATPVMSAGFISVEGWKALPENGPQTDFGTASPSPSSPLLNPSAPSMSAIESLVSTLNTRLRLLTRVTHISSSQMDIREKNQHLQKHGLQAICAPEIQELSVVNPNKVSQERDCLCAFSSVHSLLLNRSLKCVLLTSRESSSCAQRRRCIIMPTLR